MAVELTSSKPGYREFNALKSDGTRTLLSVRLPHQKELQYADIEMSVAFNRAQEAGLPVRARLLRKLKLSGQWTDLDQNETNDLRQSLKSAQDKFADLLKAKETIEKSEKVDKDKDEKLEKIQTDLLDATTALQDARQLYGERVNEFNSMTQHTADEKSDIAYRNFLIACVIERASESSEGKKGSRYFSNLEEFLNCNDPALVERLIFEFQACQNNMPSEWTAADKVEAEEAAKAKADADAADLKAKEGVAIASGIPFVAIEPAVTEVATPPVLEAVAA